MKTHEYPPMLGSPDDVAEGTAEWAERLGLRLKLGVEHIEQFGIDRLIPEIERALNASPAPWEVFPEERPCKTVDRYFEYAAGINCKSLRELIHAYKGSEPEYATRYAPLVRRLVSANASGDPMPEKGSIGRGRPSDRSDNVTPNRGNQADYLLRRLARDAPEYLDAFERGEYASARAAAIAAGILKPPTPLADLRRAWNKASEEERTTFRESICG